MDWIFILAMTTFAITAALIATSYMRTKAAEAETPDTRHDGRGSDVGGHVARPVFIIDRPQRVIR